MKLIEISLTLVDNRKIKIWKKQHNMTKARQILICNKNEAKLK